MPENPTVTGYVGTALIQPTAAEATGQAGIDMRANITEIASKARFLADAGTMTDEAWTAPTLVNSWVDSGGASQTSGYRKNRSSVVELRGLIKNGTATPGTTLFTLPSGYRPLASQYFGTVSNGVFAYITVTVAGVVVISAGTNTDFSLDSVRFSTV